MTKKQLNTFDQHLTKHLVVIFGGPVTMVLLKRAGKRAFARPPYVMGLFYTQEEVTQVAYLNLKPPPRSQDI